MSLFELGVALMAGIVSFISPCCLPMVPMYLAYLAGIAVRGTNRPVLQPAGGGAVAVAAPSRWLILLHACAFVAGLSRVLGFPRSPARTRRAVCPAPRTFLRPA